MYILAFIETDFVQHCSEVKVLYCVGRACIIKYKWFSFNPQRLK